MPLAAVLIVEDERAIRKLLETALAHFGLTAYLAASGDEGLTLFRQHRDEIGVVLADVQMPEMDGAQFLGALRQIDSTVPVVFMSGNTGVYSETDLRQLGAAAVVLKPFPSLADLVQVLRQAAACRTQASGASAGRVNHETEPASETSDRRRASRQEGKPLRVLLTAPPREEPAAGLVLNRSAAGLCLRADQGTPTGSILNVQLPAAPEADLVVEVRHCRREDHHWLLGCQFVNPPSQDELALLGFTAG